MTFATFDPNTKSSHITLSSNNLIATADQSDNYFSVVSTVLRGTGKLNCEITPLDSINPSWFSIGLHSTWLPDGLFNGKTVSTGIGWCADGYIYRNGIGKPYGATWGIGDILGIQWDADVGTLHFCKSGIDQGEAYTEVFGPLLVVVSSLSRFTVMINFGANELYIADNVSALSLNSVVPSISVGLNSVPPLIFNAAIPGVNVISSTLYSAPLTILPPMVLLDSSMISSTSVGTTYLSPDSHFSALSIALDASMISSTSVDTTNIFVDPSISMLPSLVLDMTMIPTVSVTTA
jgi:hypothetical protein